ncbi:MAG: hypothetical protein HC896_11620 [Bacteroidales bacterium]|nr:hypothetical protein [Bacteroidales bacterium]
MENDSIGKMIEELPCQKEGMSTKGYFRAYATAKSMDLNAAREKALVTAKGRLAGQIETTIKQVTDNYMNERTFNDAMEFEEKFENLTRAVVNQKLTNIEVICEKQSITNDNKYNKFIAIQIEKETFLKDIDEGLSKQQKLQVDYDKKKFEELLDAEMDKLAKEQGN